MAAAAAAAEAAQGRTTNPCCAALEKKHLKLLGKCSKLEEIRNEFRKCTALVQKKYDVVEKENGSLKTELEELKVQADIWKEEKEKGCGRCVDLDDEVSALKEEIQTLKSSQDPDKEIRERLNVSEKQIKHLKVVLDKERQRAAMEKKNEKMKSAEALKEEKKKVSEAEKVANLERKRAEENRLLWEKLKTENDSLQAMLGSERSKDEVSVLKEEIQVLKQHHEKSSQDHDKEIQERLNAYEKQIEHLKELLDEEKQRVAAMEKKNAGSGKKKSAKALKEEKKKVSEAEEMANVERKNAEENRLLLQELKTENNSLKEMLASERSKVEAAERKVEDEVSVLKEEIQMLKHHHEKSSQGQDKEFQERLNVSEEQINNLKELLDKEKQRSVMEKKNAESEKKKSAEALKEVDEEKKKFIEAEKVANVERKNAEENRLLLEKLKTENESLKDMLASERSKVEAAEKKVGDEVSALKEEIQMLKHHHEKYSQDQGKEIQERLNVSEKQIKDLKELLDIERQGAAMEKKNAGSEKKKSVEALKEVEEGKKKASEAEKVANVERKKAEESRHLWEKLKTENDALKAMLASEISKTEAAEKKVKAEKLKAIAERKRADLVEAKSKEKFELVEMDLKKAMLEKGRADDLNRKLEEANIKAEKFEELNKRLCSEKSVWAQPDKSKTGRSADLSSDVFVGLPEEDAQLSKRVLKIILEKDDIINQERKCALSAKKKAKKQKKFAEAQKKLAKEQKHRSDELFNELQSYKLKLKESQKELRELVSQRIYADNASLRYNEAITESYTVKLLKERLKLEKMLVKRDSEMEDLRNNMLQREFLHLKQESSLFQQRLKFMDKSFLHDFEGTNQLEKIGNRTSTRETFCSDRDHVPLVSGIDYRLDPLYRGSNQKMLKTCAINSSSSSFSDRALVGSQKRYTSSVTTSDKLSEDISNLNPTIPRLSGKKRTWYNECHTVANADNHSMKCPGKDNENQKRVEFSGKKRFLDAVEPIENSNSKVKKLHQSVLKKLSFLPKDVLKENSGRELVPLPKRRKTSHEGEINIHCLQDSGMPKSITNSGNDKPGDDVMMSEGNQCLPQDFDERAAYDYMKLLDLDDAADEISYRKAIAKPLSPFLPEVRIREGPGTSHLQHTEDSIGLLKSTGSILGSDTLLNQIHVAGGKYGMSDVSGSGNKETDIVCDRGLAFSNGCLLRYFVVSSDHKDNASILRILQTMDICMPQCSFLLSTDVFLQSILNALSKAMDLSMKEKACVFFSLALHGISEVGRRNPSDFSNDKLVQSYDSVTHHINLALSDPTFRRIFTESFDLFELLAVMKNLILERRVFTFGEHESTHGFKASLVLNGNPIAVSEVVPPSELLVAGSSLLGSFCSAVDHIGFVCEISCNIVTMHEFDRPLMLSILHAFARACGSEYFTLQQYALAMTVVKSLVTFSEKQTLPTDSTSSWLCSQNCLFSEGAISMENVASLLLEKLWKHDYCPQDLLSLASDEKLCDFTDILSLVEILASFMSWDWTFDHIVSPICEYMESHFTDGLSAAIIVLLGQLGRLGVDANGYEDEGVMKLRGQLSAFVCDANFLKSGVSVQFAVVASLFGLTRVKFEEIIEGKVETPEAIHQSVSVSFIREWFSRLSGEQQSLFRLHQA